MAEYYIRLNSDGSYGVAKFDGHAQPETEYTVRKLAKPLGKLQCDCLGAKFQGRCKHVPMVARFINEGERMPFHIKEST